MSRTHDRRHALRLVFQMEFFKDFEPEAALEGYFESFAETDEENTDDENSIGKAKPSASVKKKIDRKFVEKEFYGTIANKDNIDQIINDNTSGWNVSRLSKTDLAILRLAVYEIIYADDVPFGVSINEAVEMAKIFSSDESPSFINGVLGQISEKLKRDSDNSSGKVIEIGQDENGK